MRTGLIFDVQKYSVHDGPGIRTTVFFKGCPLSCWWCHNPESQGRDPFVYYNRERCLGCGSCVAACPEAALSLTPEGVVVDRSRCRSHGACVEACPSEARRWIGRRVTVPELLNQLEQDRIYYDESGGGVTFSGGEPLLQWRFLTELLAACGERDLHRTVDTTGFASSEVLMRVAEGTDLFLYDLKVMDAALHDRVTGVPLAPILTNLRRLLRWGARVRVRVPLIPGITTDASIERTAAFLGSLSGVEAVDLLPFHRSAEDKHRKFGIPWRLETSAEVPDGQVAEWSGVLEREGLAVTIGG